MTNPHFRPIAPLDVDDHALESVNDRLGVPTMVRPGADAPRRHAAVPSRRHAVAPSPQQKLTIRVPTKLIDTLKRDALEQRTTVRQLVLLALKASGYEVADKDLAPGAGGNC